MWELLSLVVLLWNHLVILLSGIRSCVGALVVGGTAVESLGDLVVWDMYLCGSSCRWWYCFGIT